MTPEQRVQFESQGFLHVPGALDGALLSRFRSAFDAAAAKFNAKDECDREGFADIPHILDQDDAFIDLVDAPRLFPILLEVIGGDIQLLKTQARVYPPGKTFTAPWHSDLALINGIDLAHCTNFVVKAHFYPEDLTPEQGCLAFIPGSHRYPVGYPRPNIDHRTPSPATVKIVPKAGDVVLFNVHLLHMALDNASPLLRKSLIYTYSHFWVKNYPSGVPKDLERIATTPQRKQLFGIPTIQGERDDSIFEQTLFAQRRQARYGELLDDGRKLLSKAKRTLFAK
jgi:phytanoyl-CoA hydroxylase